MKSEISKVSVRNTSEKFNDFLLEFGSFKTIDDFYDFLKTKDGSLWITQKYDIQHIIIENENVTVINPTAL